MLNLHNPIVYTEEEKKQIGTLLAQKSLSGNDMWIKASKDLKHRISEHTLTEQGCRCAYCESILQKGDSEIEHFVPKSKHPEFTFEPQNLTTACGRCNSTSIKSSKDTINEPFNSQYEQNSFKIIHPYLSPNPDEDLPFTDASRTTFDKDNCTPLGIDTIDFFKWDDEDARLTRMKEAAIRNEPMNVAKLVREISTYK